MNAPAQYLTAIRAVLTHLETTQMAAIERGAELIAGALRRGGAVWCSEIGHGIQGDFIGRAGGLAAVQRFSFNLAIEDKVAVRLQNRPRPEPVDRVLETARLALRASHARGGDVMVLGSVSGRNLLPVELALACRKEGVRTIGLTSLAYTARVSSLHPSGKKLGEVVDVAIDNGAPYGDAAVEIEGYDHAVLPVSGAACAVIGHMLWGGVMEKMAAAGAPATVFMSINREGGTGHYQRMVAQYEERGY